MTFDEYQKKAALTAVYPRQYAVIYPALGLSGEAGEVAEKVKKCVRDDGGQMTEVRRMAIKKELGDCAWYIAAIATDLGLSLGDIAQSNLDKLAARASSGTLRGDGDER